MEQLPVELLKSVVEHCDFLSCKQLRLTCKTLASVATPYIYQDVHMGLFGYGLEKLFCMADHSEICTMVKTFTFHADLLPGFRTQQDWEEHIDLRPPFKEFFKMQMENAGFQSLVLERGIAPRILANELYRKLPRCTVDRQTLDQAWIHYQQLRKEQKDWDVNKEGTMFEHAICKFPNLRQAAVPKRPWGLRAIYRPVWRSLYPLILQSPDNWIPFQGGRGFAASGYSDSVGRREGAKHLTCLLEALSLRTTLCQKYEVFREHTKPVTSLTFTTTSKHFWDQSFRPDKEFGVGWIEKHVAAMSGAFRHVQELYINVMYNVVKFPASTAKSLRLFLKEASGLQKLHLEWTEDDTEGRLAHETHCDLLSVIADITWPKLYEASLSLITRQDSLIDFLKRYASTLRHLQLKDVSIREGTGLWQDVIEQIPRILSLETIHLEALWDIVWDRHSGGILDCWEGGAYEMAIINYCLHGGAEPPILDPDEWDEKHPDVPAFASWKPAAARRDDDSDSDSSP